MIKQFIFKDFKCFKDARINIENLTFLIGTNASGKTNAIEGMMILSELMTGREIAAVLDGSTSSEGRVRGGSKGCGRLGRKTFTLGCLLQYDETSDLEYEVEIDTSDWIRVKAERLTLISSGKRKGMFQTKEYDANSAEILVSCNNGKSGKNPEIVCTNFAVVISQLISKLPTDTQYGKKIVAYSRYVIDSLKDMLYLSPAPVAMRNYASINDSRLKMDASNISAVLYKLCDDPEKKADLLKVLQELPENEIVDISFEKGPLNDVILFLKEKYGERIEKTDAMRLSDGTLRCLAVLAAVLGIDRKNSVVTEEIDNGIHPARAQKLILAISEIARKREIDVLVTTHNAVLLNGLTGENMLGVNVVYRNAEGDGTAVPIMDIPNLPILLTNGRLGDVFLTDEILKYIKKTHTTVDYSWLGDLK